MKLKINVCPECGEPAISIIETLYARAFLNAPDETGEQWYSGSSEMLYDSQEPEIIRGEATVQCDNLHEWNTEIISYYWFR
jgi:hypothetical protein